jgi:hypothetical protein
MNLNYSIRTLNYLGFNKEYICFLRLCKADMDPNSGRWLCRDVRLNQTSAVTEGQVQLWEVPWNDSRIMKECICEVPNSGSVSFTSVAPVMDIVLTVSNMLAFHDQDHFYFEGR